MIAVLIALWIVGFWWLSILLVCLYMPSFLNGDHLRLGRPWHAFRFGCVIHRFHLTLRVSEPARYGVCHRYCTALYCKLLRPSVLQRYMEMSLTREQRLDPKKQFELTRLGRHSFPVQICVWYLSAWHIDPLACRYVRYDHRFSFARLTRPQEVILTTCFLASKREVTACVYHAFIIKSLRSAWCNANVLGSRLKRNLPVDGCC